ncbi:uncharacterized protein VTP21DRAFT_6510 [Calcarisporiella thermophila]|uniref:uncharacterized protein n=1 Tax=Calcarisporiella thermophila TaxID=911321 RepID=UPI0037420954
MKKTPQGGASKSSRPSSPTPQSPALDPTADPASPQVGEVSYRNSHALADLRPATPPIIGSRPSTPCLQPSSSLLDDISDADVTTPSSSLPSFRRSHRSRGRKIPPLPPPLPGQEKQQPQDEFHAPQSSGKRHKLERVMTVETAYSDAGTLWAGQPPSKSRRGSSQHDISSKGKPESIRIKRKRRPALHQASTPAEIFAANIASAVSEAEDSEEQEHFIYRDTHSRKSSVSSHPGGQNLQPSCACGQLHPENPHGGNICPYLPSHPKLDHLRGRFYSGYESSDGGGGNEVTPLRFIRKASNGSVSTMDSLSQPRPLLRSDVAKHNNMIWMSSPRLPLQQHSTFPPPGYGAVSSPSLSHYQYYQQWELYEDAQTPLTFRRRPIPPELRERERRSAFCQMLVNLAITMVLVVLLTLAAALVSLSMRPLTEVQVSEVSDVATTLNELQFDLHVRGRNWNIVDVAVDEVDLLLFASSLNGEGDGGRRQQQEFLGTVRRMERPLLFPGVGLGEIWTGLVSVTTSKVRLQDPLAFERQRYEEDRSKWSELAKGPFKLTLRGILKYRLGKFWEQRGRVCAVVMVLGPGRATMDPKETAQMCGEDVE